MIIIKTDSEIEYMVKAGKVVAEALDTLEKHVKPGISTGELDRIAEEIILGKMPNHLLRDTMVSQLLYVHL